MFDKEYSNDKQIKINQAIEELSREIYKPEIIEKIIEKVFVECYSGEFRHSYSQIFATIESRVLKNPKCSLEVLGYNMKSVYKIVHENPEKYLDELIYKIDKLYDHIMLEIARIGYLNTLNFQNKEISATLKDTKKNLEEIVVTTNNKVNEQIQMQNDKVSKAMKKAKKEINSLRVESVTVLSILAAVMLTGMGGITILGNALRKIDSISTYKFIASTSFVGLIIFNTIFMLLCLLAKITGKDIFSDEEDNTDNKKDGALNSLQVNIGIYKIIINKYSYVYWFNIFLLASIIITLTIEYLAKLYPIGDWLLILFAYLFVGLSICYRLK